ncbi:MAG: TrmB family transcriptional regulator [Candidatus Hodarchaeales archaeon]
MPNGTQEKAADLTSLSNILNSDLPAGLHDALLTLGLSKYESQVLASLYILKESEVKSIALIAKVPMGRIYDALNSLTQSGLIQKIKIRGKPLRYRAYDYKVALKKIYDNVKEDIDFAITRVMESVTQLQEINVESEPIQEPVEVIFGESNISMILIDTILRAENDIILTFSVEYLKKYKSALETVVGLDVNKLAICVSEEEKQKITALGFSHLFLDPEIHIPALKSVFFDKKSRLNGIFIDNKIVFITLPHAGNEPYGIRISHPSLVLTFTLLIQSLVTQLYIPENSE